MLGSNPSSDRPTEGCVDARCVRLSPRGNHPPRGRLFCFRHVLPLRVLPETRTVFGFCDCAAKQSPTSPASMHPSHGSQNPRVWGSAPRRRGLRPGSAEGWAGWRTAIRSFWWDVATSAFLATKRTEPLTLIQCPKTLYAVGLCEFVGLTSNWRFVQSS